jgi:hypothetical protein
VAVHIYTLTIHRATQITTNVEECGPCLVFASFSLAFALQLRKKARKTLSQGKKTLSQVKKNLCHSTVYILPKHPHITKPTQTQILQKPPSYTHTQTQTHTHTHTLQNNIKPSLYKLKQTQWLKQTHTYTIGPTDHLHSSPAPHLKNLKVFLVCLSKCPSFSTIHSYAPI